jgi:hypothetical protein
MPSDAVARLGELLAQAGLKVQFDPGNNQTHPCTFCGKPPNGVHDLRVIGNYPDGSPLSRPVCKVCSELADASELILKEQDERNRVKVMDIVDTNFFGQSLLHTMAQVGIEKFQIAPGTDHVTAILKINGIEVPLRAYSTFLEKEFQRIVDLMVGQRILEEFNEGQGALQKLLYEAERSLKEQLRAKGLLQDEG